MATLGLVSSGERALLSAVSAYSKLVVAFSGGVDSALLAVAARKALGRGGVSAVTADSASLASGEAAHCRGITEKWDIPWVSVATNEFDDQRYLQNDTDRCFWCKTALMDAVEPIAQESGATIALGVNLDDLGDHRPGQLAAAERGAVFPLVEAGLTKHDVREIAKNWGLAVWDRPAMPCLSSRVPYGTSVSVDLVSRIDRAEHSLRSLGFNDVRVRHYRDIARIELPVADLARAIELCDRIDSEVKAAGYRYVTLDLAGLRSGNLNHGVSS
ncbi:MAG: ATP-dependent sacrificial sulfur transferase LarE [Acidimicrobiia bacterium]|nr:ATP-dependent sacrificial sulfur transferase LarE [Acidimicrobiia bacterium]